MTDHYAELEQEYLDLQERLGDQDLLSDQRAYAKAAKRYSELEEIVQCIRNLEKAQEDINTAKELLGEAVGEERDILREEMNEMQSVIEETEEKLRELLIPKDPNDDKNVIIEIRGAEGGEEANLFARDLFEMYSSFAGKKGWSLEVLTSQQSDIGGFTSITFLSLIHI